MTFLFEETLLDCGGLGHLALTLAAGYSPPMPAHKYGYATLHRPGCEPETLALGLFTRAVPPALLRATLEAQSLRLAGAVQSVLDGLALSASEVCDEFGEAPSYAQALSGGRVLLLFCGKVQPHVLRVVSIEKPRICAEETIEALRTRLKVKVPGYMRNLGQDAPVVYASNDDYLLLYLGAAPLVLHMHPQQHRLERAQFGESNRLLKDSFELQFTQTHVIKHEHADAGVTIVSFAEPYTKLEIAAKHARKAGYRIACARRAERMALAHPMGVVEVLATDTSRVQVLRPLPNACGKDGANLALSPNGHYLFMADDAGTVVVDIDGLRVAYVQLPTGLDLSNNAAVRYRPTWQIGDDGTYLLENAVLTHTPWSGLEWQDLAPHSKTRKAKAAKSDDTAALTNLLASLARPALALKVSKKPSRSHLYGTPHIAALADWPQHNGYPLLLLCELHLAELAAANSQLGLPASGSLQLFVAVHWVDGELELLDDDEFSPEAHRVLYCATPAELAWPATGIPAFKSQHLQPKPDKSSHPRADSLGMEMHAPDAALLEAYFQLIDKQ